MTPVETLLWAIGVIAYALVMVWGEEEMRKAYTSCAACGTKIELTTIGPDEKWQCPCGPDGMKLYGKDTEEARRARKETAEVFGGRKK